MKFGICTSPQSIARLAPGTADYVEMNLSQIAEMSAGQLADTAAQLRAAGVPAESTNGFFPRTVRLNGAGYRRETVLEYSRRALEKAAQLGIHTCVLGSGGSRNIEDGYDRAEAERQFEEAVAAAGDAAAEFDTTVVLEPLNHKETNLLHTVAEGAVICRRLHHPHVMLLADLYHVGVENEPMSVIEENGDILRHVHIACPIGRGAPKPLDPYDYRPFARALKAAGYDLRISIEGGIPGSFRQSASQSLAFLRQIFR